MAMQVSYMGGSIAAAAQQVFPQEKRPPLPVEQKAAIAHEDSKSPLPDSTKAPDLNKAASDLEHMGLAFNRRLKFEIDQESREIVIKIIDNETDKVIRVLPPEELQRLHSSIRETIGFLFDRMV